MLLYVTQWCDDPRSTRCVEQQRTTASATTCSARTSLTARKTCRGFCEIAQAQALYNAIDTHLFILKLDNWTPPGPEKNALNECVNAYSLVSNQFQEGLLKFAHVNYAKMCSTLKGQPPEPRAVAAQHSAHGLIPRTCWSSGTGRWGLLSQWSSPLFWNLPRNIDCY